MQTYHLLAGFHVGAGVEQPRDVAGFFAPLVPHGGFVDGLVANQRQCAVGLGPQLHCLLDVCPVTVAIEHFLAAHDQLHRAAHGAGGQRGNGRVQPHGFAAESAAHKRANHAHISGLNAECFGQRLAIALHALAAVVHRELAVLPVRNRGVRLQGVVVLGGHFVGGMYRMRRALAALRHIAACDGLAIGQREGFGFEVGHVHARLLGRVLEAH